MFLDIGHCWYTANIGSLESQLSMLTGNILTIFIEIYKASRMTVLTTQSHALFSSINQRSNIFIDWTMPLAWRGWGINNGDYPYLVVSSTINIWSRKMWIILIVF